MNGSAYKILLVDDEQDILDFLKYNLEKEGYRVITTDHGKTAVDIAKIEKPDLVVLDIMMPEMDGVEVCRQLRAIPALKKTLIIFLTARSEDYSEIAAFEAGADDYIVKPIRLRAFTTRIKAFINRKGVIGALEKKAPQPKLVIDSEKMIAIKQGEIIQWPKKEFELLSLLSSRPGRVFSRQEIFDQIWGNDQQVDEKIINVYIRKIRQKIGSEHIKTIIGKGYKFEE
jgi:two-component system alkaline phosphatase synthesis response regulator PhoP